VVSGDFNRLFYLSILARKEDAKMKRLVFIILGCITLISYVAGCGSGAHNPMSLRTGSTVTRISEKSYPGHTNKVFVTTAMLPEGIQYEEIANIDYGKSRGGEIEEVFQALAEEARNIGADAVIGASAWRSPRGYSWRAPQGKGIAVRLLDESSFDWSQIEGNWY
jgi:hypothetical protein